jgi:hypothetical protein
LKASAAKAHPNDRHVGVAWLSQQLAYPSLADESGSQPPNHGNAETVLQVANRADCRLVASIPIPGELWDLTAAAGLTVVLYSDATGVYLNGYAP